MHVIHFNAPTNNVEGKQLYVGIIEPVKISMQK